MGTKNLADCLRFIDRNAAKNFASLVVKDIKQKIPFKLEMNPGFGYLTEELLEAGVPHLHLFEKDPKYAEYFEPLVKKYPNRLFIKQYNFLTLSKTEYIDNVTKGNKMKDVLQGIPKHKWNDEPSMHIIGAVPQIHFFFHLQNSMMSRCLADYGRIVLYVVMLPSMSRGFDNPIQNTVYHRPKMIYLRTLFDYEILGTLPRCAFSPQSSDQIKRKKNIKYYINDNEYMHIVKLVPKLDYFDNNFTREDAEIFYSFLALHLKRFNLRIIPELEKWIPHCGPRLIKLNFDIFTKFSELSELELLKLFKIFKSWPEYKTSVFLDFIQDIIYRRKNR